MQFLTNQLNLDIQGELPARAEWKFEEHENGTILATGWGQENTLTLCMMTMQDGSAEAVIVESMVDSPIKVHRMRFIRDDGKIDDTCKHLAAWVNKKLTELTADPLAKKAA